MDALIVTLVGLALVLAIAGAVATFILRRNQARLQDELEQLRGELRAMTNSAAGVGRKLAELELRVARLIDASHEPSLAQTTSAEKPYQMAAKLMQRGADIEELMTVCGLTRGEAELLASLHRKPVHDDPVERSL